MPSPELVDIAVYVRKKPREMALDYMRPEDILRYLRKRMSINEAPPSSPEEQAQADEICRQMFRDSGLLIDAHGALKRDRWLQFQLLMGQGAFTPLRRDGITSAELAQGRVLAAQIGVEGDKPVNVELISLGSAPAVQARRIFVRVTEIQDSHGLLVLNREFGEIMRWSFMEVAPAYRVRRANLTDARQFRELVDLVQQKHEPPA